MKKLINLIILIFLFASSIQAALFTTYGSIGSAKFKPKNSPVNFEYDVFYYIPKKLQGKKNLSTLVFLHGGGASTSDRAGSARVAKMYIQDLKTFADNFSRLKSLQGK